MARMPEIEVRFSFIKQALDVLRYEEVERLAFRMVREIPSKDHEEWIEMWAKHEDRPLTQKEVWNRAVDFCVEILDGRLDELSQE